MNVASLPAPSEGGTMIVETQTPSGSTLEQDYLHIFYSTFISHNLESLLLPMVHKKDTLTPLWKTNPKAYNDLAKGIVLERYQAMEKKATSLRKQIQQFQPDQNSQDIWASFVY